MICHRHCHISFCNWVGRGAEKLNGLHIEWEQKKNKFIGKGQDKVLDVVWGKSD